MQQLQILKVKGLLFLLFFLLAGSVTLYSQSPRDRKLEQTSVTAFNNGNYKEALPGFTELLSRYPRDPMYNYYHGVCLVSLTREPEKATAELRLAALSSVPGDVFFYLGKAAYQQNNYAGAIKYFERFRESSDIRDRNRYYVNRWINVCQMYIRNPQHHIRPENSALSYRTILDTAMKYQQKLDSVNYLLKTEQRNPGSSGKEKDNRIAVLEEEKNFYAKVASESFFSVRALETSGAVKPESPGATTGKREVQGGKSDVETGGSGTRGGSPYLERMGDRFYRQPGFSAIFELPDQERLDQLGKVTAKGNALMEDALEINNDIEKNKVVANAARHRREAQQARKNIRQLEKKKMNKRMEAISYYQAANDEQYALYNKYLDRLAATGNAEDGKVKQGLTFRQEAENSRKKAFALRSEAEKQNDAGKKYDKLMEANAYELIALDNQKKALGTLAGIVPVAGENVDITRPVADIPKTAVPVGKPSSSGTPVKTQSDNRPTTPVVVRGKITKVNEIPASLKDAKRKLSKPAPPEALPAKPVTARAEILGKYPYGFAVRSSAPYDDVHPIPGLDNLPEGVNYKIQIAAFSKQPELSFFRGMYPLSKEAVPGKNLVRYYAGLFRKYDDALKALLEIRRMGFPDALIVGFYNGERSSLERIRWLEDELPFENVSETESSVRLKVEKPEKNNFKEKEEGMVYRIQLGAFSKHVPQKKMDQFQRLAGNHKVIITRNGNDIYVYSIGNFLTFEDAEAFKEKLAVQGMEGVFVTAYRNGRKIPLKDVK
ncbi:MAG: SPOR domain-containing protein [Chlorobi bacterium]|nr:SPOR domain-containing protein [Chlorobiota bacterium]